MSETSGSRAPVVLSFPPPVSPSSRPRRHSYCVAAISLAVSLVLQARLSWRAAAGVLAALPAVTAGRRAAFTTIRGWLLRLGLFVLRRPLPVVRGPWVLLVDHTIQLGPRKALVVLGLPLAAVRQTGFTLSHRDVTVLAVEVLTRSTAERVHEVLQGVQARVGTVAQVVSDHGADLVQGIRRLQQDHPHVVATYDVRHALACLLKAEWEPDPTWQEFVRQCGRTQALLRQTAGQFLAPPSLRHKARYMNVAGHVAWAQQWLAWEATGAWPALAAHLGQTTAAARDWWREHLGWLAAFRPALAEYGAMLAVVEGALAEVQGQGLSAATGRRFWLRCEANCGVWNWRVASFAGRVRARLQAEGELIPEGAAWLGSSDVIESLFGKYKALAAKGPGKEFEATVLLLPLLTREWSAGEIKEGLEAVTLGAVEEWVAEQVGRSPAARKRQLLAEIATESSAGSDSPKAA